MTPFRYCGLLSVVENDEQLAASVNEWTCGNYEFLVALSPQ